MQLQLLIVVNIWFIYFAITFCVMFNRCFSLPMYIV